MKVYLILKKGEKIIQSFSTKKLLLASIVAWNNSFGDYNPMKIVMAVDNEGEVLFSS